MRAFGRYQLKARIAQGGMGEVFLAVQQGPGGFEKHVAIKQCFPVWAEDPALVEMFVSEAKLVAGLSHPNICQTFDLGVVDGRYYIAMEYLAGQPLSRIWRKGAQEKRPLTPELAAWVVASAAEGLAYAHEKIGLDGRPLGIVHRDVSPHNVMVTYEGQVKVVDFGIARAVDRASTTAVGQVRGKLAYMSPEQVQGQAVDLRSDVFALGIVLHELLAQRPLFRAESDLEILRNVLHAPVPSLAREPGVPAFLAAVVAEALERDLARRLPSAHEFARRIQEGLRGLSSPPDARALATYMQALFVDERAQETARLRAAQAGDLDEFLFAAPPQPLETTPNGGVAATRAMRARRPRGRRGALAAVAAVAIGAAIAVAALVARRPHDPPPAPTSAPAISEVVRPQVPVQSPVAAPSPPQKVEPAPPAAGPPAAPTPVTPAARAEIPGAPPRRAVRPVGKPPRPSAVAAAPRAEPGGLGRLTLVTTPWSEVFLGERRLGVTPLFEVELPAGSLRLRAVNRQEGIDRILEVVVRANETTTHKVTW